MEKLSAMQAKESLIARSAIFRSGVIVASGKTHIVAWGICVRS